MKLTGSLIVCAAAGLFTAGALLFDDAPAPAQPGAASGGTQIEISGFAFASSPVAPGSSVVAANRDAEPHTVTAADGSFDSGPIGSGLAVSFAAPAAPGTYAFVCTIHPSMTGQLVVG